MGIRDDGSMAVFSGFLVDNSMSYTMDDFIDFRNIH